MATSVVPAVMSELKTLLQGRAGLAGVQIVDGMPWQPDKDYMAILDADPHEQRPAGMRSGPHPQEEEFVLHVRISALRKGDADHQEVTARAFVLAGELENQLQNDRTIGGSLGPAANPSGGWAILVGLPVQKFGPDKDGQREAVIDARIECRARI